MSINKISGSCLCGKVVYSSDAEPLMTPICHCKSCQRQTGTAFSVIVVMPEGSVEFENSDTLAEYQSQGQSGGIVRRQFCKNCGSPIISFIESAPGVCALKTGTLNDTSWLKPTGHIWCSTAQPWVDLDDGLSKDDQNPT